MNKADIPVFETFDAFYEAIGSPRRSHIPGFDVFTAESLEPAARRCMAPYRQGFYQIGLLCDFGNTEFNLNTDMLDLRENPLLFVVPGQVFSWVRDKNMKGFFIVFKKEFLGSSFSNLVNDFPFLKISEKSTLALTKEEHQSLLFDMQRIHSVAENPHPYQEKMLEGMLGTLLYFCKAIFERNKTTENHLSRSQVIANKFEVLVDKMYVDTKNVSDYADQLHITPNYLTTTIKKLTGKSAKDIINERLLVESKTLLKYSGLDIAEIAHRLNFQEPTHFTRFFKKLSGTTPNQFRKS
ncbi:AraC-type DNA-binding protein [Sinomicrobium oceani]|uniref:AraC-type DNA-binding protein n=1 Tax=Sinomicrobium oceani TaxID=1150368 RepID=A0A1K1MM47_9FLAO|nr:AraC family transcriptional regulator [Sinomicrobium oceani]SFW24226.1 AraC-type DNA-binding protein [Sinomicrobium oceani]